MNKKKLKKIVCMLLAMIVMASGTCVYAGTERIAYKNELGMRLNEREYAYIRNFMCDEELKFFTQDEIDYVLQHVEEDGIEEDTKYVRTSVSGDDSVVTEEYISEEEMLSQLNAINVPIKLNRISTLGLDDREDEVKTAMKSIVMKMYSVAPSAKKVSLTCNWISIPKTKSYDIIAFRVGASSTVLNSLGTSNINGYQYYDGEVIKYTYSSDNLKSTKKGLGLSMNIVDSVKKSLKMELSVTFGTNSDPFTVYGTYQHSVDDITLKKSKKYTISSDGMGGVIKFKSNSVEKSYDDTPGLVVTGSISDT